MSHPASPPEDLEAPELAELGGDTLDPRDWGELRALGHRMIDDMFAFLETVRERPPWRPVPREIEAQLRQPAPSDATPFAEVYRDFTKLVLPYPNGNIHPRFWGWVQGTGTPFAMLADLLASGLNPQMAGFAHAAVIVEQTVISWCQQLLGFGGAGSGLLTSGGTMANLTAVAVARHALAGFDVRAGGLQDPACPRWVVYGSTETHSWARKSMELLGFGHRALRLIDVDDDYRISVAKLRARLAADRAAGLTPLCILGNAGTVNTGAIDDLHALADVAAEHGAWFHVDGAFGALAYLSLDHRELLRGMQRADSLAFDLHKWMSMPFEAGCVLVQRPGAQRDAFVYHPAYIAPTARGVAGNPSPFADLGIELSRGFKALKIWMSLKAHGSDAFGAAIAANIRQAQALGRRVERSARLQLMAPVSLNVVCFRYRRDGLSAAQLDALNQEVLLQLQERGIAVPSGTTLRGGFALRVANVNHRTVGADLEALAQAVERLGDELGGAPAVR
jgi:aromatic-L-amino-acid/L-tryptophan decarboxylase